MCTDATWGPPFDLTLPAPFVIASGVFGDESRVLSLNKLNYSTKWVLPSLWSVSLTGLVRIPPFLRPNDHMMISTPVRAWRRSRIGLGLQSAGGSHQHRQFFYARGGKETRRHARLASIMIGMLIEHRVSGVDSMVPCRSWSTSPKPCPLAHRAWPEDMAAPRTRK